MLLNVPALWRGLVVSALALTASNLVLAQIPAKPPAIADFFRTSGFSSPRLSPDGGRLAAIISGGGGEGVKLAVFNLADLKSSKVVASFSDVQIANAQWVNDKRLVFTVSRPAGTEGIGPGLWSVDSEGQDLRQLISPEANFIADSKIQQSRMLAWTWSLRNTLDDGSDDVIVQNVTIDTSGQLARIALARLNTLTSERSALGEDAPPGVKGWVLDRQGQPLWATTYGAGRITVHRRLDNKQGWQAWDEGPLVTGLTATPVWVGPEREVYALQNQTAKGTAALFRLDSVTGKPEANSLVALAGYDLEPNFVYDAQAKRLAGIHFETDAPGSVWFDPAMKAAQIEVDKQLPATVNILNCTRCTQVPTVLVTSVSDRSPATFYLYNRDTKALTLVASTKPWIDPRQMARRDVQQFAARDGLNIPVQVTLPKQPAKGPWPAVVLVHGGPNVRGNHWTWEPSAQLLASRGYLVIEPEYRGSMGYGFKHFQAGWKRWGQEMQDDVTDATHWAIKQGLADPKRICIAGASYGGYATLMGLIREHELYKCGIDWVGVTDIEMLYTVNWSDAQDMSLKFGMPVLIGDPVKDKAMMQANSPLLRAAEVKRPLLMAYGEDDVRVPMVHGTRFRDAVKQTNPDVEWVNYIREGHGWRQLKTNLDFWGRVERFLDKNIGADK